MIAKKMIGILVVFRRFLLFISIIISDFIWCLIHQTKIFLIIIKVSSSKLNVTEIFFYFLFPLSSFLKLKFCTWKLGFLPNYFILLSMPVYQNIFWNYAREETRLAMIVFNKGP
jgi:hypothetical protein